MKLETYLLLKIAGKIAAFVLLVVFIVWNEIRKHKKE